MFVGMAMILLLLEVVNRWVRIWEEVGAKASIVATYAIAAIAREKRAMMGNCVLV